MNTDTVKESSEERSAQDQVQSQSQGATNLEKLQIDNSRSQAGRASHFFNEKISSDRTHLLNSSTCSSSSSSPISPLSPLDASDPSNKNQTTLKQRPPTHLPLFGLVLLTSSPLQSISEQSGDGRRDRLKPAQLNLDVSATASDLSDDVFQVGRATKPLIDTQSSSAEDLTRPDFGQLFDGQKQKRKTPYGFMSQTGINEHKDRDSDVDTTSLLIPLSGDQASGSLDTQESLKLKRSQAFPDLPTMDDFSSVTFRKRNSRHRNFIASEAAHEPGPSHNENHASAYIEEKKIVVPGIRVRAAKISKLVQLLMDSFDNNGQVLPYTDFPRVFILMHKWFMESVTLTEIMFDLYNLYTQYQEYYTQEADKQYYAQQQLKICYAFNFWLNKFPFHFALDSSLLESVKRFINLVVMKKQRHHLQYVDITKIESYDWMRKLTSRHPLRPKQNITLAFNKIEPEVLACQLTFLEWKTLRRIHFSDYQTYAIKGSLHDNPPLEKSIQLFNGLSQWIQCMVLSKPTPRQRADIIHKFIGVARHLRLLQNFNSLMAVIGGICHSALARLTKTNLHLSLDDQKTLNEFMELLSSNCNYGLYRKTIAEIRGFYIPIIGIHLKDIISLHTAHLDKLESDLINFRKMAQLSVIFQSLTDLQNSVPPVQENRDLIKLLQLSLDMSYSEDEMYEFSLAREPRTSVSSPSTPTRISPFADWAKSISTPLDPQTIQKHVNAMVEAVYKNYDHDKDGFISHDEFNEIVQNFPFIDTFAVLDADKDGMISKIEMKAYFLKANYNALKSEFKHEFHETTYFKLTFCTHCDGLLWGLIKQGWKCKDCGISAHRLCKERVVIECRPKRTNSNFSRLTMASSLAETSTSSLRNRSISNRSSAHKKISFKQKATQTDIYDELFMSDDSLTSNEEKRAREACREELPDLSRRRKTLEKQHTISVSTNTTTNMAPPRQAPHTQRTVRRHFKKNRTEARRKSLPLQASNTSDDNQHLTTVTLIPRGPLICSNNEGLETHFFSKDQFFPNSISRNENNRQPFGNATNEQVAKPINDSIPNSSQSAVKHLATPESVDYELGIMSIITNEDKFNPHIGSQSNELETKAVDSPSSSRNRLFSDFNGFRDYIHDGNMCEDAFSSNEEEDVFYKLKEEGERRLRLERENAKLKKQITTLKEEMSIIKNHDTVVLGSHSKDANVVDA